MSPIEHYFENLLTMGADIKGEPNKNVLSKEVQEAIEICADYIKNIQYDSKADMVAMLTELQLEIEEMKMQSLTEKEIWNNAIGVCSDLVQQKIDALKTESGVENAGTRFLK